MMQGFFTKEETASISRPDGKFRSCVSCGLYKHTLSPRMKPFGNFKKGILNLGDTPDETDDKKGKQWQGKVGRRLQQEYKRLGINLFEDCLNINAINCRPTDNKGDNREPSSDEIACCRSRVLRIIQEYNPRLIIAFGNSAISCLLNHRWKKDLGGIVKWRGWTIPDRDFGAWICPIWHPSYVDKAATEVETIWLQDLKRALSMHKVPLPSVEDDRRYIQIIDSPDQLDSFPEITAFDYETTGRKPHLPEHQIICAAVAYHGKMAQVFMMPEDRKSQRRFIQMLRDPSIKKMAHNLKFEEAWSIVKLRQPVQNWYWDSMLAAHLLDNRANITSLKFQAYINFGVVDYDSEIEFYLKGVEQKNGNSLNRIQELIKTEAGKRKLLEYCGLDALYEYRLAMKQMEELS